MKKYKYGLLISLILLITSCANKSNDDQINIEKSNTYMLPHVLILTTGNNDGNGVMGEGIILATQVFNKFGVFATLETRDILLDTNELNKYSIILALTAAGYHDADRKYSLTFMSDEELNSIKNWVKNGGIFIAGDNIGRNLPDATDRTSLYGKLTPGDWALGECFGIALVEKYIKGFRLDGFINDKLNGNFIPTFNDDVWALVIDTIYSDSVKILANWTNDSVSIPALIQNSFGKGACFLLPSSYLLHPSNSGGYWSVEQIELFYKYVIELFYKKNNSTLHLNIWPDAAQGAFCVTFNLSGNKVENERILNFLEMEKIIPTFFVNQTDDSLLKKIILKYPVQSNGYKKMDFQNASYFDVSRNITINEKFWEKKFSGFKFPFSKVAYVGFEKLCLSGYHYDSSIGLDNSETFYGCAFPYNIIVSNNLIYKNTGMLEISPILNDDYYYFKNVINTNYNARQLTNDIDLYDKYLKNCWNYSVKPYNGLMVFNGHACYVGFSDSTIKPLKNLINTVKSEKTWITDIDNVYKYWNNLSRTFFNVSEEKSKTIINVKTENNILIENLSIKSDRKPVSVKSVRGESKIVEQNSYYFIIFDAFNNQKVTINY